MSAFIWFIIAVVLVGLELAVGEFTLLMLAGGALLASGGALLGLSASGEILVFIFASVVLWLFLRPALHKRIAKPGLLEDAQTALVGKAADVIEEIDRSQGQIMLDGSVWSARSIDPDEKIPVGQTVVVSAIDGPIAIVWKGA